MDGLKGWLATQMDAHLVEPNGSLGKAMVSMQRHWETLTRFLSVPGAPIDNNLAERVLKLFIRQRKNSLFYKSTHSAYIASVLTSLIVLCQEGLPLRHERFAVGSARDHKRFLGALHRG